MELVVSLLYVAALLTEFMDRDATMMLFFFNLYMFRILHYRL